MEQYLFNIDTERKIWDRHTVCIVAASYGEAVSKVIEMAEYKDVPDTAIYQRLDDTETDTGRVVILDDDTTDEIYSNTKGVKQ
jgi:hypothetical protein